MGRNVRGTVSFLSRSHLNSARANVDDDYPTPSPISINAHTAASRRSTETDSMHTRSSPDAGRNRCGAAACASSKRAARSRPLAPSISKTPTPVSRRLAWEVLTVESDADASASHSCRMTLPRLDGRPPPPCAHRRTRPQASSLRNPRTSRRKRTPMAAAKPSSTRRGTLS